jgi:tetratricopeptide (TPR) repeat protein
MRAAYEADLAAREPRVPQAGRAPAPEAPAPPPPPPPPQPVNAEALIRQAERFVSNQKWWDAIQALEAALPHAEGKPRNRARLLLAKALLKNPHWIKRGEEQLNLLIKDDPHNAEAYFMLAEVYKGGGLRTRAVHMLRKALEVKPDHEGAAALLAELGPPPEAEADQEKGGLLKKLFGKN